MTTIVGDELHTNYIGGSFETLEYMHKNIRELYAAVYQVDWFWLGIIAIYLDQKLWSEYGQLFYKLILSSRGSENMLLVDNFFHRKQSIGRNILNAVNNLK